MIDGQTERMLMSRLLLVLVVIAVIAIVFVGMSRSWRRQVASGADIPAGPDQVD